MTPTTAKRLHEWFPSANAPFLANAPMFGFAQAELATAVSAAGGFGIHYPLNLFAVMVY